MAKGRKRKVGKREKNGRISRAGIDRYDKGTEYAQEKQALYGQDGCDAIGRAYQSGLLGTGNEAKALLDTARAVHAVYWSLYPHGRLGSTLGGNASGAGGDGNKGRERYLAAQLLTVAKMGRGCCLSFSQLVIEQHGDTGPDWLDSLLADIHNDRQWLHNRNAGRLIQARRALKYLCAPLLTEPSMRGMKVNKSKWIDAPKESAAA